MEEATLRAKIQAMKNLLEANSQTQVPKATHYYRYRSSRGRFNTVAGPVNRSWNRYSSPDAATKRSDVVERSINKVWRRKDYTDPSLASANNKPCKRPVKMTASKCNSIQVQVPKDGEYAMVNGGFGLARAVVKKPTMTRRSQAQVDAKPILTQTHSKNVHYVHIGGEMYIVANGGKLLKRCSKDERKANIAHRRGMMGTSIINGAARAALVRAKATIERARSERVLKKRIGAVRTVYCSLYNRFGYCKKKDKCRFIHDSRRVAMCRKFMKNECKDTECLLSHLHDENKAPDCKMFLRGFCTRESCKYRHVKVSVTADLCEAFTNGFCQQGSACPLRHELSCKPPSTVAIRHNTSSDAIPISCALSTSIASSEPGTASGSSRSGGPEVLSIRPNIRFASKHSTRFPAFFGQPNVLS